MKSTEASPSAHVLKKTQPEELDLVILGGGTGSTIAAWTSACEGKRVAVEKNQQASRHNFIGLLKLGVLRLGFFQDGDVGVGVFPEREEIFVGGECPDAGGIDICTLRGSRL
jgi:hypothetical protein